MIRDDLYQHSIEVLKLAAKMSDQYYGEPLIICYSGGKDSDVLLQLAKESGIRFEVQNSHTTVDAPETVYHIREVFKDLNEQGIMATILYPHYKDGSPMTMWNLIVKKRMPPTRLARYCCQYLKEQSTPNRFIALGVREQESTKRKGRSDFSVHGNIEIQKPLEEALEVYEDAQKYDEVFDCKFIELAKKRKNLICNPIYYWYESDVWDFIRDRGIKYNPLYDRGYKRVGCIGCPMGIVNGQNKTFIDYPKYKEQYIRTFEKLENFHTVDGNFINTGKSRGQMIFDWWMQDPTYYGQITFEEEQDETD